MMPVGSIRLAGHVFIPFPDERAVRMRHDLTKLDNEPNTYVYYQHESVFIQCEVPTRRAVQIEQFGLKWRTNDGTEFNPNCRKIKGDSVRPEFEVELRDGKSFELIKRCEEDNGKVMLSFNMVVPNKTQLDGETTLFCSALFENGKWFDSDSIRVEFQGEFLVL